MAARRSWESCRTRLQERRRWLSKERFVEGLSMVNMLPGPRRGAASPFPSATRKVASPVASLPAFASSFRPSRSCCCWRAPMPRSARCLPRAMPSTASDRSSSASSPWRSTGWPRERSRTACRSIAVSAVGLVLFSPFGLADLLLAAGCAGVTLFHSWRTGLTALLMLALALAGAYAAEAFIVGPVLQVAVPSRNRRPVQRRFGCRRLLLEGRRLHVRRRSFDARLHAGAGRQPVRLADAAGIRRRPGAGSVDAGADPDAGGLHRLQAVRGPRRCGRGRRDLPTVVRDGALDPAAAAPDEGPAMAQSTSCAE